MATTKKRGFMDKLLLGSEKSEGYARSTLPSNRWELFWDIFKSRFWKLVLINVILLLFLLPLFLLIFVRYVSMAGYGMMYPFSQCFGVGYMSVPELAGYSEQIVFTVNRLIYILFPFCLVFASFGLAGGCYVLRNMVWTEGIFVANDIWRGIKNNWKKFALIALIYGIIFYLSMLSTSYSEYMIAISQGNDWFFVICEVVTYVALAIFTMIALHMMTMTVTYDLTFRQLIKNGYIFATRLIFHNIFFILIALIPLFLMLIGGILQGFAFLVIILIGISFGLLVWTNFCQWSYDKFINDKIEGAKKNRGIYQKIKNTDSEAIRRYKEQMDAMSTSSLATRPIKPITDDDIKIAVLPTSFNRDDIAKLDQSKKDMISDHEKYVEEHMNDPQFKEFNENKQKLESEQMAKQKRIEDAKKALAKRNKKGRR